MSDYADPRIPGLTPTGRNSRWFPGNMIHSDEDFFPPDKRPDIHNPVNTEDEDGMQMVKRVRAMWVQVDRLAAAGIAVFSMDPAKPLQPDALARATCDRATVDKWWLGAHAGSGYGLILGPESAGLFALYLTGACRHWRFLNAGHRGTLRFDIHGQGGMDDWQRIVLFRRPQGESVHAGRVVDIHGGSVAAITTGVLVGPGIYPNGDIIARSGHAAPAYAPRGLTAWINARTNGATSELTHIGD